MNLKVCLIFLAAICLYPFKGVGQSHYSVNGKIFDVDQVNKQVKFLMQEVGVPGLSVVVINNGKIVFSKGYGYLDLHSKHLQKVNRRTKFVAASLSKSFVVYAAYQLIAQGLIQLDTPMYKYLEYDLLRHDERYKLITPRMVLSHTSGIENNIDQNVKDQVDIIAQPGTAYTYSGEGYVYLSKVIEKIRNKPIEQILKEEVYQPLKLKDTYTTSVGKANINHAAAHDQFGRHMERWKNTKPFIMSHIHTTAVDYARLLLSVFDYKHIDKSLIDVMLTPQILIEDEKKYGPGFELNFGANDTLVLQGGDCDGFKGLGLYSIKNKSGFVYFGNSERSEKIGSKLCEVTTGMDIKRCFSRVYDNQYPSEANDVFKAYIQEGAPAAKALVDKKLLGEVPKMFTMTDMIELVYYLKDDNYELAKYIATEYFKKCPDCDGKMVFKRWLNK